AVTGEHEDGQDTHGAEGILVAGRYRLLERLGAGGMGRVWKAYDESLDCEVAVKEVWLPPMLSDAERAERLARAQREARNAARMRNHPHIVSVHDMVSDKGMPWIVMDLIPSQNLMQVVEQYGPLPAEQLAKVGLGVLAGDGGRGAGGGAVRGGRGGGAGACSGGGDRRAADEGARGPVGRGPGSAVVGAAERGDSRVRDAGGGDTRGW